MEIRRLFIYGLIFGGLVDLILVCIIGNLTGRFGYINYGPFGLLGIHIMAPISWTIFFIIYFYLLPEKKVYIYPDVFMGFFFSILFGHMISGLSILKLTHPIDSIIAFLLWFPIATWGYFRLTNNTYRKEDVNKK